MELPPRELTNFGQVDDVYTGEVGIPIVNIYSPPEDVLADDVRGAVRESGDANPETTEKQAIDMLVKHLARMAMSMRAEGGRVRTVLHVLLYSGDLTIGQIAGRTERDLNEVALELMELERIGFVIRTQHSDIPDTFAIVGL